MNAKVMLLLIVSSVLIGSSFGSPQRFFGGGRRFIGLQRPPFQQGFGQQNFGQPGFGGPLGGNFGNANAAGLGNGFVQNNQAVGTGTGIANVGPGGFGIGLGVGAAVATPIGNFALGEGQSFSAGK